MRCHVWAQLLCVLWAHGLLHSPAGAANVAGGSMADKAAGQQLASCAPTSCQAQRTVWDHMLNDVAPCLVPYRTWFSTHTSRLPVTLITQLSVDRLSALKAQCQSWAGPLAAAVYLPLLSMGDEDGRALSLHSNQQLQAASAAVQEVMDWAEAAAKASLSVAQAMAAGKPPASSAAVDVDSDLDGAEEWATAKTGPTSRPDNRPTCQLRIVLMYELFAQKKAVTLYPINSLRNYARLLADSPLIANIDVDMLGSVGLSASLLLGWDVAKNRPQPGTSPVPGSAANLLELATKERTVFVLPAFETSCGGPALADRVSAYTKRHLALIMAQQCLSIFRYDVAPVCHNATDFPRWLAMGSSPAVPLEVYPIVYEVAFEPWFISLRQETEWFDVRYRGYGKNKIQQVAHTAMRGTVFRVHPTGFIVHRPHTASNARKSFLRIKFKSRQNAALLSDSLFQHVEQLWEKHSAELLAGTFEVTIDAPLAKCLKELPWWKDLQMTLLQTKL